MSQECIVILITKFAANKNKSRVAARSALGVTRARGDRAGRGTSDGQVKECVPGSGNRAHGQTF